MVGTPGSGEIFRALILNLFWSSVVRLEQAGAVVVTHGTVWGRGWELSFSILS